MKRQKVSNLKISKVNATADFVSLWEWVLSLVLSTKKSLLLRWPPSLGSPIHRLHQEAACEHQLALGGTSTCWDILQQSSSVGLHVMPPGRIPLRAATCPGVINNSPGSGDGNDGSLSGLGRAEKHVGGSGEMWIEIPMCRLSLEIYF